ncbi:MAG: chemotaxis protein CheA [Planctomycetota bacterium]|nr:chemotaxis protein CheA [Planctomycetota bacterium]
MDNKEFVQEFLVESSENLDQLDRDLVALEETPDDPNRLASIFRTVHTIKGTSGFFGFSKLGALAHSGEHLLGRLRDGTIRLNEEIAGTLLSMVDAVRAILRSIEETGGEGTADFRELADAIAAMSEGREPAPPSGSRPRPSGKALVESTVKPTEENSRVSQQQFEAPPSEIKVERLLPPPATQPEPAHTGDTEAPSASPELSDAAATPPRSQPTAAESSVRVDVGLLGSILDLVGELVLARNQLRLAAADVPQVQDAVRRVHAVTSSLQETAMKTRMQPIAQVFSRFPRVVRDLSVSCGKEVRLEIDGAETELDRTLIESIRDPLTHLVRNAVDHGIEPPAERLKVGKPQAGVLSLRAFHESGQVTVEVRDDGRGIPVDAIRRKAVSRGLIDAAAVEKLSDEEILQYIFEPGFSTAAAVTDVSGRGVGMDVVKTNIEAIGGTVDVRSTRGEGTTIRVRIPLTLAIIPALIVRCGPQRLAIPQASVCELVPLARSGHSGDVGDRRGAVIEGLETAPVIRLRGQLLPVVSLSSLLGLEDVSAIAHHPRRGGTVVRVRVDDHEFGLIVDDMQSAAGTAEAAGLTTIVVKPASALVAPIGLYAGATVMGDGGVTLIIDLRGVARAADIPERLQRARQAEQRPSPFADTQDEALAENVLDPLVICRSRHGRRVALPARRVSRLERFAEQAVEQTTDRSVVRHAGSFLPLVDLDDFLSGTIRPIDSGRVQAVVVNTPQGPIGLVVDEIVDVAMPDAPPVSIDGIDGNGQPTPGLQRRRRCMVDVAGHAAELLEGLGSAAESSPSAGVASVLAS